MRILFTGASSFTGLWFVQALAEAGHEVIACIRSSAESYSGLRQKRIEMLKSHCRLIFQCPFGSDPFLRVIEESPWDLLCHHAADVTNYKSPEFDPAAALINNTFQIKAVLKTLQKQQCHRILLTGSVFEQNEGVGTEDLRAVSPYGLSKGLTSDVFRFYTTMMGMRLGKFVIPNPFGPYEEVRYTTYLAQAWLEGKTPAVNAPDYVRDNVPVSLLAKAYAAFAHRLQEGSGYEKYNPSFYAETQGEFTARFAQAMRPRLKVACAFDIKQQVDFPEPRARINTET